MTAEALCYIHSVWDMESTQKYNCWMNEWNFVDNGNKDASKCLKLCT